MFVLFVGLVCLSCLSCQPAGLSRQSVLSVCLSSISLSVCPVSLSCQSICLPACPSVPSVHPVSLSCSPVLQPTSCPSCLLWLLCLRDLWKRGLMSDSLSGIVSSSSSKFPCEHHIHTGYTSRLHVHYSTHTSDTLHASIHHTTYTTGTLHISVQCTLHQNDLIQRLHFTPANTFVLHSEIRSTQSSSTL